MKKLSLGALLLLSTIGFSQEKPIIGMGMGYSTANILDVKMTLEVDKLLFGIGGGVGFNNEGIGTPTKNFYFLWNDQILYNTSKIYKTGNLYLNLGYRVLDKFIVYGKPGIGFNSKAKNYLDPSYIFGEYGYHYTEIRSSSTPFIGGGIKYDINKNVSAYADYDRFSKLTLGLAYNF